MALKRHRAPPTIPAAVMDELQGERGKQGNGAGVGQAYPPAGAEQEARPAAFGRQRPPIALLPPLALLTSYKNDAIILYHFFYRPLLAFRLQFNHSAVNTIGCKQFLG